MTTERLRELAVRATKGPWEVRRYPGFEGKGEWFWIQGDGGGNLADDLEADDAAYIAAANPTAILSLLDELDALRKAAGEARSELRAVVSFTLDERVALREQEIRSISGVIERVSAALKGSDHDN